MNKRTHDCFYFLPVGENGYPCDFCSRHHGQEVQVYIPGFPYGLSLCEACADEVKHHGLRWLKEEAEAWAMVLVSRARTMLEISEYIDPDDDVVIVEKTCA